MGNTSTLPASSSTLTDSAEESAAKAIGMENPIQKKKIKKQKKKKSKKSRSKILSPLSSNPNPLSAFDSSPSSSYFSLGGSEWIPFTTSLTPSSVISISSSSTHTLCLDSHHLLHSISHPPNNSTTSCTIPRDSKFPKLHLISLETSSPICSVIAGEHFSMALTEEGELYSWGDNRNLQCGLRRENSSLIHRHSAISRLISSPTLIRSLSKHKIIQVACGSSHTLSLTDSGELYAFGSNLSGQLGIGHFGNNYSDPQLVSALQGFTLSSIACGESFSIALTLTGTLYSWGSGEEGQLGVGEEAKVTVKSSKKLQRISDLHQQEHPYDRCLPTHVHGEWESDEASLASTIEEIACGRTHVLARTRQTGEVYLWGTFKEDEVIRTPQKIPLAEGIQAVGLATESHRVLILVQRSSDDETALFSMGPDLELKREMINGKVIGMESGGDLSYIGVISETDRNALAGINRWRLPRLPMLIEIEKLKFLMTQDMKLLESYLEKTLTPHAISGSFLTADGNASSGLDLDVIEQNAEILAKIQAQNSKSKFRPSKCLTRLFHRISKKDWKHSSPLWLTSPDRLRLHCVLLIWAPFLLRNFSNSLSHGISRWARSLVALPENSKKILFTDWLTSCDADLFSRMVRFWNDYLSYLLTRWGIFEHSSRSERVLLILSEFHSANLAFRILPITSFYNLTINRMFADPTPQRPLMAAGPPGMMIRNAPPPLAWEMYTRWITSSPEFSFCRFPFALDPSTKASLVKVHTLTEMRMASPRMILPASPPPAFVLTVRRSHLIQDTMNQLLRGACCYSLSELKRPMKVTFVGEPGVDAGGVKKEFFQLILSQLMQPQYGMFDYDEARRMVWFTKDTESSENEIEFELIGMILSLAVYHGIMVPVGNFPKLLWRKLLGETLSWKDVEELDPDLAKGLQQLLEYEGGDDEDVFGLRFEVIFEKYGKRYRHELIDGGSEIEVTAENKREYVRVYQEYLLVKSVEKSFNAFSKGFWKICGGPWFNLFQAEELEKLMIGSERFEFVRLKEKVVYRKGFTSKTRVIQWFWEIVESWKEEDQKKMLGFATGSDRVPLRGLGEMMLVIQRSGGDTDKLPTASTCFNTLNLPAYGSKEKLRQKLLLAIQNAEGFGLQ